MNTMLRCWLLGLLCAAGLAASVRADEVIPPKPTRYFTDNAALVRPATAQTLNNRLEDLEKQSSNQILVVIYLKMQTDSSIEDFCHRIYAGWGVGQKGRNNGAVLFVFAQDHKLHIETGRGLEGPLPDSVCKDIISDTIRPKFQAGDYDGGLSDGVAAMIQRTSGEFKGTGTTANQQQYGGANGGGLSVGGVIFLVVGGLIFLFLALWFPRVFGGIFNVLGIVLNIMSMSSGGRSGGTSFGGGSSGGGGWSSGGGDSGAGGGASGDW